MEELNDDILHANPNLNLLEIENEINLLKQNLDRKTLEIEENKTQISMLKDDFKKKTILMISFFVLIVAPTCFMFRLHLKKEINHSEKVSEDKSRRQLNDTEKWQIKQMDWAFGWKVDQIADKRQKVTNITSAIFYPRINSYKMQLTLWNFEGSDECIIRVLIHPGEMDSLLTWPYKGNVTINITNRIHPNTFKGMTKNCTIERPKINSYTGSYKFIFLYSELSEAGLIQDDNLIIECYIK